MNQTEAEEVKGDDECSVATTPPVAVAQPIYYDPNMTTSWPPPPYYYPPMPMAPPPGPYYFAPYPPFFNQPAMGMGGYDPYNANGSLTPLKRAWSTQLLDCFSDFKISEFSLH